MKIRSKKQAQNGNEVESAKKNSAEPNSGQKKKAIHYGELEIIPTVVGDCYILADGEAVMSERGFANWLGMSHISLRAMLGNWPPKTLEPFCNKGLTVRTTLATIAAENCPHKGVDIVVYDVPTMEEIIRVYAVAYTAGALRKNQLHIGKRCAELLTALIKSSLRMRIAWACGFTPQPQKTVRRYHRDSIFQRANDLLFAALKLAYPNRDDYKYRGLMATCFDYVYTAFLGKELYANIKKTRNKSYPIHHYIEDEVTRRRCVCYILMLANDIAARECRIPAAKQPGLEATQRLIAAQTPRLAAASTNRKFAFMREEIRCGDIAAVYYGEVHIGDQCGDGYILHDGSVGLSENSTAAFMGMDQKALQRIGNNGLPHKLRQFLDPREKLEPLAVKVAAANSPHRGRCINFYSVADIELLLRVYAFAHLADKLQKNQRHIGDNCLRLVINMALSTFEMLILEACGLKAELRQAMEREFRKNSLAEERELVLGAVTLAYPNWAAKKRQALLASAFRFAYHDALTSEQRNQIKGKISPLHQHIEDPATRNKLSRSLALMAGAMALTGADLEQARERARGIGEKLADVVS